MPTKLTARRALVLALLPLLPLHPASGATTAAETTWRYPARYTPAQIHADFDLFESAMREAHSGLHVFRTPEEIDAVFAAARQRLDGVRTERELYLVMSRVVAEVQDGHTSALLSTAAQDWLFGQPTFLPYKLAFIDGEAYLHRDYSDGSAELLGSRLIAINGVPMETILGKMLEHTRSDGRSRTGKYASLTGTTNFGRLYQLLFGPSPQLELEVVPIGEEVPRTVTQPALTRATLNERFEARYPELADGPRAELTFLEDPPSTAVMRISGFFGDALPGSIDDAFRQIHERKVTQLVVDLRDNGGGREDYGQRLFSYLTDRPFLFYDRVVVNDRSFDAAQFSDRPGLFYGPEETAAASDGTYLVTENRLGFLAEQQPREPGFRGDVYVLIDGGSFSTTTDTCTAIHQHTDAVFIGEEAGGSYYGNTSGNSITVTLPHTKARVRIPLERYYTAATGYEATNRGLTPHHQVARDPQDLVGSSDAVLEFGLDLVRASLRSRPAPGGGYR